MVRGGYIATAAKCPYIRGTSPPSRNLKLAEAGPSGPPRRPGDRTGQAQVAGPGFRVGLGLIVALASVAGLEFRVGFGFILDLSCMAGLVLRLDFALLEAQQKS